MYRDVLIEVNFSFQKLHSGAPWARARRAPCVRKNAGGGGGGEVNFAMLPLGIAQTMSLAIVTSRESEPGKSK